MRQVRFADKANIVDKYGADAWFRILDCKGVRELNSPSRHDGKYPMICNLCDMKNVETREVQGMREHFAGRGHYQTLVNVMNDLRRGWRGMLAILAVGWDEDVLKGWQLLQFVKCDVSDEVMVVNLQWTTWR